MGVPLSKLDGIEERIPRPTLQRRKSRQQLSTSSSFAAVSSSTSNSSNSNMTTASGGIILNRKASAISGPPQYPSPSIEKPEALSNLLEPTSNYRIPNRPSSTPPPPPSNRLAATLNKKRRYPAQSNFASEVHNRESGKVFSPSASDPQHYCQRSSGANDKAKENRFKSLAFDHNDEQEYNRQLRQHYVFKQVIGGNTVIPFEKPPEMILDSASGSGFWSLDMAQAYPDAKIINLDLSITNDKAAWPNIFHKVGDIMNLPLQFESNTFDLIHQRDVGTVLPLRYWQPLLADFYRILKPNGIVQLVEYDLLLPVYGQQTRVSNKLIQEAIRSYGYDAYFTNSLGSMLHQAGFTSVEQHVFTVPVGEWAEDDVGRQQGFLYRELIKALFRSLKPRLAEYLGVNSSEYDESCAAMLSEVEENKGSCKVKIFTARKL